MSLQSYKPYARIVTIVSAIIIAIAGLDASQVIHLFPEYASQINTILMIAGLIAPAIAQEKRVVRAEDLVKEEMDSVDNDEAVVNEDLTVDGESIDELSDVSDFDDSEVA